MPEGDFVRRVCARLTKVLVGRPITYCLIRWPGLGGTDLTGATVTGVDAYGKHIFMRFDTGFTLRTHLRMDGTYLVEHAVDGRPARRSRANRWTARVVLANREYVVIGDQLGMADLVRTRDAGRLVAHLGPDVMGDGFDAEAAGARLTAQGDRPIGAVLLDQTVVAGFGTIYLAETLWRWRVRPDRPACNVPDPVGLLEYGRQILWRSVKSRSATATGDMRPGYTTAVHGRAGQPCRRCGAPIAVMRVGAPPYDRPAYYCPTCQPD
jgi:endonuclease-8